MIKGGGNSSARVAKLDSITFANFWSQQDGAGESEPVIDLRPIELIMPSAIVQLASALHAYDREGRRARLLLDGSPVASYLERARFTEAVERVATLSRRRPLLPGLYSGHRGTNPLLIEVTKIENGDALPKLLDRIVSTARNPLKYRKNEAFDIATVISEVCQNTFDHNDSTCGFLAMQVYGKGTKRFLEIGISDHGVGLRETLQRNPKNKAIRTDLEAIQHATRLGTSQHDDPTRGTGLYHLLELTYRHGGTVQIWSGAWKVRYRMDKRKGWSFSVPQMCGVHVAMSLPTKAA